MFIKKESVDNVFEKAQEKFKETGIKIKPEAMKRFEETLSELANRGAYEEGAKLNDVDLTKITNEIGMLLGSIASGSAKIEKPAESLMILTDYLYAMTMKTLGSPDIPMLFGSEMQKSVSNFAARISSKQDLDHGSSFDYRIYEQQRGKDAGFITDKLRVEILAAEGKAATPRQVQTLVAEYHALSKRQKDHNFFWRMFHRAENTARKELLSNMETLLKGMLGENVNLMARSPLQFAEKMIENKVANDVRLAFAKNGIEKRGVLSSENLARTNSKQIDSKIFFQTGYRPDLENIDLEWNAVKPIYDAVQSGKLFGERNAANIAIKEILSKNYIRLRLFKAKVEKDGVESSKGLYAEMEPIYDYEDAQFNQANPNYAAPEIPTNAEKEKVEVIIDEPEVDKSKKIEEPDKSAIEKSLNQ